LRDKNHPQLPKTAADALQVAALSMQAAGIMVAVEGS
jgi:hypothetical protein